MRCRRLAWVSVLLVACTACTTAPPAPLARRSMLPPEEFARRVAAIEEMAAKGEHQRALEQVRANLAESPPDPFRQQLRRLQRELLAASFYDKHPLHLSLQLDRDRYTFEQQVGVRLRITNLGRESLALPARHRSWLDALLLRPAEASVLLLTLDERDVDGFGAAWGNRRTIEVPIDDDIEIGPGGGHTIQVAVTQGERTRAVHRRLGVSALFRPIAIISAGGDRRYDPIEFPSAHGEVIRAQDARWFDGGLALLTTCVEGAPVGSVDRLFAAAIGLRDHDLRAGIDLLARAAPSLDPPRRRASLAALALLTGIDASRDPVRVLDWWETTGMHLGDDVLARRAGRRAAEGSGAIRAGTLEFEPVNGS